MTQVIGTIEPLVWTKASTSTDFSKWLKIFECTLVINGKDVSEAPQAKAMLYAYGGDKIRMACEANADYTDATFAQTITHLKAYFQQETTKLDALMLISTKPKAGTSNRLRSQNQTTILATALPIAQADFMVLIIIARYTQSTEIRNKAMETATTLKTLLEWQAMNEVTEKLDDIDIKQEEFVRHTREPRLNRKQQSVGKKKRSASEKKRKIRVLHPE